MSLENHYLAVFEQLLAHFGPQRWWPAETPFEMMVGAILTQNTSWSNVEKAISNLREADLLNYPALSACPATELAGHIRPAGYYNLKAQRLLNLCTMLDRCYLGSLEAFLGDEQFRSRENLLAVRGVGPETADSILLYACGHPVFVVDMYTHRVFSRHNLLDEETDYPTIQQTFVDHLPVDTDLYNEYHALIVRVATQYCKKSRPRCELCPLQNVNR
jgi:endonuclease-3 related protein